MPRTFIKIARDFDALAERDFDYANASARGWERLAEVCDEMLAVNDPAICAPVMFRTMERLDGVELGTPGPLVHTLETWRGSYEKFLKESVRRKPTPLSVWMINRILNARPPYARSWVALLRSVANNPPRRNKQRSTRRAISSTRRAGNGHPKPRAAPWAIEFTPSRLGVVLVRPKHRELRRSPRHVCSPTPTSA